MIKLAPTPNTQVPSRGNPPCCSSSPHSLSGGGFVAIYLQTDRIEIYGATFHSSKDNKKRCLILFLPPLLAPMLLGIFVTDT